MAHGFSQHPIIDYKETYSPVIDVIMFHYLISLVVYEKIDMQLIDMVTSYLYRDLDTDVYMKVPDKLKVPEPSSSQPRNTFSIKLRRSLYWLKQFKQMWYNHLSEYLTGLGTTNYICPCVFIKKSTSWYVIITVYVDYMNFIGI